MRVSKEKVVEHRHAILETASRLFRERGIENVSVAEIMKASGLTHGAFYGHFRSKADLAEQAFLTAGAQTHATMLAEESLDAIIADYLSPRHRDTPARGCPIPALCGEIARQSPAFQDAFARTTNDVIAEIERRITEPDPVARRREAVAAFATLVGAVTLARGVAQGDAELSDEILDAARTRLAETLAADRPEDDPR
ncbi:TetR family transcriptional regulator [Ancylobacter pratisalsi]|uniref:TetR family transcriptional regulator n=1 Tax=Ancylobacter pratisalsi TaxID=1745854 RepID=A0A6P1YKK0_9HYPH|nr:TetR family transcriptional regulator [Ancylobacter pratisalsi]QIB33490.1 TetR family transcriptional regulator [Ancylobacter pratisalsi]